MTLVDSLALALAAGAGWMLATVLHELTHVVTVWPISRRVGVDWRNLRVTAEIPDREDYRRLADAAGVVPVLVGVVVALTLPVLGYPLPDPWTPTGVAAWAVWARYTVMGGLVDFVPRLGWVEGSDAPEPESEVADRG